MGRKTECSLLVLQIEIKKKCLLGFFVLFCFFWAGGWRVVLSEVLLHTCILC